jgi:hypothetical protein
VLKQNGLIKKRKKKWQKRRDLRELKKKMKLFSKLQMDVKELGDIEKYWLQMMGSICLSFKYSAREQKTGESFMAFAYNNNSANAALFEGIYQIISRSMG